MFEIVDNYQPGAVIKVIGVGGGGGNAVNQMVTDGISGVDFIAVNTDVQALRNFSGKHTLQIGSTVTKGLGAGANPETGRQAALEDRDRIIEMVEGADMVFITAGMGGGTGTGAAPVIAQAAREAGALTVAVVTRPFPFEGKRRMQYAQAGIDELRYHVDSLITIPNAKLLSVLGGDVTMQEGLRKANEVLYGAVQGIAELITRPGLINVDFADVRTVMTETGMAMMGSGHARGEDRAVVAATMAISSPLLEDIDLAGACGLLVNITASNTLTMAEFSDINTTITDLASEDANIVVGTGIDEELGDEVRVTVVATGLDRDRQAGDDDAVTHIQLGKQRQQHRHQQQHRQQREQLRYSDSVVSQADEMQRQAVNAAPLRNSDDNGNRAQKSDRDNEVVQPDIEFLDIPAFLRNQAD
ncbi:MAG: cell division protein FtsZ [Gammaproteobacteria bacterium]|nr:cell division protein FtsZ [Gammaproteobacteria bacterium]